MPVGSVMEEHALRFEQTQPHIPQRLTLLTLILLPGHKVHLRPLPQGPVLLGTKGLPGGLRNLAQRFGQGLAHEGADRKANPPARFLFPVGMLEPIQQPILMTGRIAPKVALGDGFGQRAKGQLGAGQRLLPGWHVAVPKFIGQHQIGLRPYRHHRLIAPALDHPRLSTVSSIRRPSPMPSIQMSLLTAILFGLGQMLPELRSEGVRRYIATRPLENPVSAAPARPAGTNGVSITRPVAISAAGSARKNLAGSIDFNIGNAPEAMAWMPAACSGPPPHFPIPACRMYAPVTRRVGTVRSFIVSLLPG